ncbi:MAG: hypothetical protein AAGU74_13530 [Bacillota bacterium]
MKSNLSGKLYGIIITIILSGCSLQSKGDQLKDFTLIFDAAEFYAYNASGNYFIQLVPSDSRIGRPILELIAPGNQKDEKSDGDLLIVGAYVHKFTYNKCDLTAFDIYRSAKNNELYSIPKETRECPLRHEQRGYLEFADE